MNWPFLTLQNNNEVVQNAAAKGPLMNHLLEMRPLVKNTPIEPKLITTIAAATRHCLEAEKRFIHLGGLQYLAKCTEVGNRKVKEKAALLVYHFVNLGKLTGSSAHSIDLLRVVRNLMPLDVSVQGIQYADVCINLFAAAVGKYPQMLDKKEALKVAQELSTAVAGIEQLESAAETLKEVQEALKK